MSDAARRTVRASARATTRASARATTRYVALLRGMNVGGHRVSMDSLRTHFTALRLRNVETYIASGNVIFESDDTTDRAALEQRIEQHLEQALGYAVATFLRTPDELAAAVAAVPFPATEVDRPGYSLHVGFLRTPPDAALAELLASRETVMDAFGTGARELYWLCRGRSTDSLVKWPALERTARLEITMRNLKTVRTLASKYGDAT